MDATNSLVIETRNLSKAYKGVQALKDFNLKLTPGILGLLGPNGAGKSTLMRMLATITLPTEGTILWNGRDVVKNPEALRSVLGYLPQDFGVYLNLSGQEFLEYMAAIKGLSGAKARREIADLLVVSERTVEVHVSNILKKLGYTSRVQIAVWAVEKGLLNH